MNSWLFIRWIIPSEYIASLTSRWILSEKRPQPQVLSFCRWIPLYLFRFVLTSMAPSPSGTKCLPLEGGELFLGIVFAPGGYVVCMPDYLGLGLGEGLHPYCHAKSEATATVDMLRATRQVCDEQDIHLNDQTFLFGYSQGGHATMAAARELELYHTDEFTLTASAPMSGPYDISGAQTELVVSDEPYSAPITCPI